MTREQLDRLVDRVSDDLGLTDEEAERIQVDYRTGRVHIPGHYLAELLGLGDEWEALGELIGLEKGSASGPDGHQIPSSPAPAEDALAVPLIPLSSLDFSGNPLRRKSP